MTLLQQFGQIDIYLFDQLLKGRIAPGMRVLDAGCGGGRNLTYFFNNGYEVFGLDQDAGSIAEIRRAAPHPENFHHESIEETTFPPAFADVVISSAVLHFARDHDHFNRVLHSTWNLLRPGGLFFCRLAAKTGIEQQIHRIGNGRYDLPDGSQRYLVDEEKLVRLTEKLNGELLDPIKTTVVHNQRAMATWVLRKH